MNYQTEYERWCRFGALTEKEKEELASIKDDEEAKELRFSNAMSFGTAGLRSTMNLGPACMNTYTVAHTTQGIANLVIEEGGQDRGVVIAYDSRNNSESFARTSASVLAANGIKTYIFNGIRPTPELSFAVRELNCIAGINITASHNPKEYNGYKAYWEDGAQISPEQANIVSSKMAEIDMLGGYETVNFESALSAGKIIMLDEDYDEKYVNTVLDTQIDKDAIPKVADDLKIVYTPLHGAGYRLVPLVLSRVGFKNLYTVDEQTVLDGNFPTVKKPNPEYADVFELGIKIANEVGSDLIIATDPDSDRVGVVTRTKDGSFTTITGNQMGALLLDYVIEARRNNGTLTKDAYCVKSIVSTEMAKKIAEYNGVKLYDVFTGFKFIGEVIKKYEKGVTPGQFLMGFEESYGYLFGTYARDKDAVGAALMICEMTAHYRSLGMTLSDALDALYAKYGLYSDAVSDFYMEGLDGIEKRKKVMANLRGNQPREIGGYKVVSITDHQIGKTHNLIDDTYTKTDIGLSNVLYYTMENGDKVVVRPSGTEPKVKMYLLTHADTEKLLSEKTAAYKKDCEKFALV